MVYCQNFNTKVDLPTYVWRNHTKPTLAQPPQGRGHGTVAAATPRLTDTAKACLCTTLSGNVGTVWVSIFTRKQSLHFRTEW